MTIPHTPSVSPWALPPISDRETWLEARRALLAEEKAVTRAHDAVNAQRRRLPMVPVAKSYTFQGPDGALSLPDLFAGRRQLYVHHFMWIDERDGPCLGCSMAADLGFSPAHLAHLHARDITFVAIARAPYEKLAALCREKGWRFPFYASHGSDFNEDFGATLDPNKPSLAFNYQDPEALRAAGLSEEALSGDVPANSIFLRDGDRVFHTYSAYAGGLDLLFAPHNFLDLTPYGRQEAWEDSPAGWPKEPEYGPDIPRG